MEFEKGFSAVRPERPAGAVSDEELLEIGRGVLREEARAIERVASRLGDELLLAAKLVTSCRGRVVVTGLGKSGLVGRKIAATFSSLGIPAFFLQIGRAHV